MIFHEFGDFSKLGGPLFDPILKVHSSKIVDFLQEKVKIESREYDKSIQRRKLPLYTS